MFRFPMSRSWMPAVSTTLAVCLVCLTQIASGGGPVTKLTLNAEAPVVELFDGMDQGQLDVRLTALNAHDAKIFVTNKSDKPLTVAVPKAVVGVHVLPQFGPQNGFNAGNNPFGNQNGAGNQNAANGLAQSVGGNVGPAGNNGFPQAPNGVQNQFPGNNFFSVPPEKTVQLSLRSVCLNYGRPEPHAGLKYKLVKLDSYTTDPVLQQLLEDYSPRTNREAQQAAAWHLANGLSWEQIARLTEQRLAAIPIPRFTQHQLDTARKLVKQAEKNSAERPATSDPLPATTAALRQ